MRKVKYWEEFAKWAKKGISYFFWYLSPTWIILRFSTPAEMTLRCRDFAGLKAFGGDRAGTQDPIENSSLVDQSENSLGEYSRNYLRLLLCLIEMVILLLGVWTRRRMYERNENLNERKIRRGRGVDAKK